MAFSKLFPPLCSGSFWDNLLACFILAEDLKSATCESQVSRDH